MGSRNPLMSLWFLLLLLLLWLSSFVASKTLIESLPGYPGVLPFKLETGYIGVGENETVQLFYYFVESERNPEEDPLIVWIPGGPGCSALGAMLFEIGPIQFQYGQYKDNVPALKSDPNSWTKVANIIYLDAPTLTGFSYTKTAKAIVSSDTLSTSQTTEFIRKFVREHPKFLTNPMYVSGISYSGIIIPMVTEEIYKGNDVGLEPILNIKGYIEANPLTDKSGDINSRLEYAYRMALIPFELFQSTKNSCNGEYANPDSNNLLCMADITEYNKRIEDINIEQILEPDCSSKTNFVKDGNPARPENRKTLQDNLIRLLPTGASLEGVFCRGYYYNHAIIWANDRSVSKALNVRKGTVKEWLLCNKDMEYNYHKQSMPAYNFNVQNSVVNHVNLTKRNCRALVLSGDHDMMVPHVGTHNWIRFLNLTITDSNWDAWYVGGQVAGYKTTYSRGHYSLLFATVKGAGHMAPVFKPKECFEIAKRWLASEPI